MITASIWVAVPTFRIGDAMDEDVARAQKYVARRLFAPEVTRLDALVTWTNPFAVLSVGAPGSPPPTVFAEITHRSAMSFVACVGQATVRVPEPAPTIVPTAWNVGSAVIEALGYVDLVLDPTTTTTTTTAYVD